jgi:hypothetical protein
MKLPSGSGSKTDYSFESCAGNWRQPKRESWRAMRTLRRTLNFCSFRLDTCSVLVTQLGVRLLNMCSRGRAEFLERMTALGHGAPPRFGLNHAALSGVGALALLAHLKNPDRESKHSVGVSLQRLDELHSN